MNKKGQLLGVFFSLLIFLVLWTMFFAQWLNNWAQAMIISNSLIGLEAFFMSTINIWVYAGILIGLVSSLFVGGRS